MKPLTEGRKHSLKNPHLKTSKKDHNNSLKNSLVMHLKSDLKTI